MIASLPMYDRAETRAANDRFWALIRNHPALAQYETPQTLTRGGDLWEQWEDPQLFLSQTCGLPFRSRLHDKVSLIGTPVYDLPGLRAGYYNSIFVARRDDPRNNLADFDGATFAYNESVSQSGWGGPYAHASARGVTFGNTLGTGAHQYSAQAVAEGRADFTAIDALTWEFIKRWDSSASALKEIDATEETPALPYISAVGLTIDGDPEDLRTAVRAALADLTPADRSLLGLKDLTLVTPQDYLSVPNPPAPPA